MAAQMPKPTIHWPYLPCRGTGRPRSSRDVHSVPRPLRAKRAKLQKAQSDALKSQVDLANFMVILNAGKPSYGTINSISDYCSYVCSSALRLLHIN